MSHMGGPPERCPITQEPCLQRGRIEQMEVEMQALRESTGLFLKNISEGWGRMAKDLYQLNDELRRLTSTFRWLPWAMLILGGVGALGWWR